MVAGVASGGKGGLKQGGAPISVASAGLRARVPASRVGPTMGNHEDNMADSGDLKAHVSTYDRVIALLKWGTVVCVILAFVVVLLISQ